MTIALKRLNSTTNTVILTTEKAVQLGDVFIDEQIKAGWLVIEDPVPSWFTLEYQTGTQVRIDPR